MTHEEGAVLQRIGDGHWRIGSTEFVRGYGASTPEQFRVRKPQSLVARYAELATHFDSPIVVELGIAAGGSTALVSLLFRPALLIAFELRADPIVALEEFIRRSDLSGPVLPCYGVDQSDRERVAEIVDVQRAGRPLDLVIDDASHEYEETVASFETLFPRLRAGGLYVIEDWEAHDLYSAAFAGQIGHDEELRARLVSELDQGRAVKPPLSRLVIELVLARAVRSAPVREVRVTEHWVLIERGEAALDGSFSLRDLYRNDFGLLSAGASDAASAEFRQGSRSSER
jgi:predicted O-methyltransferase YrrM